jgi:hypothetical protein
MARAVAALLDGNVVAVPGCDNTTCVAFADPQVVLLLREF